MRGYFLLLASTLTSGDLEAPFTWLGVGQRAVQIEEAAAPALSSSPHLQRNLSLLYQLKAGPSELTGPLSMGGVLQSSILLHSVP